MAQLLLAYREHQGGAGEAAAHVQPEAFGPHAIEVHHGGLLLALGHDDAAATRGAGEEHGEHLRGAIVHAVQAHLERGGRLHPDAPDQ
ncbi:MAG TPA: hypothetical protein ENO16_02345 [Chromatiales bacterium]|nr:hypothetical protein [Chromatiales bacterium]